MIFLKPNEMAILPKVHQPDNFESHNSLKLSFTNIRGLFSNFIGHESSLKSNSTSILALCKTDLEESTDSREISVRVFFLEFARTLLIICVVLQFMGRISLENPDICFRLVLYCS